MPDGFPRLRDLLTDATQLAAFVQRHPDPALVIDKVAAEGGGGVDTPSGPFPQGVSSSTEILGPLAAAQQLTRMGELVNPEAQVAFLSKSERNPFGGLVTLGRARNNDLVLGVSSVSKLHAIFTHPDERWLLEDDDSANGTFLNGSRLPAKQKTRVNDGDSLRFGPDVQCRLYFPASLFALLGLLRGAAR